MSADGAALSSLLERHARFWRRGPADRPLLEVTRFAPLQPNPDVPLRGGRWATEGDSLTPETLDLDRMLERWPAPDAAVNGDFLREAEPYGICWMEGLMGAAVRSAAGTIWAEPAALDWPAVARIRRRLAPGNPWHDLLRAYLGRLADQAAGRVPVVQPLMRGPVDILEALVGTEELVLAMYDHPAELREALEASTDAFIQVGQTVAELTPPFHGGHSVFQIWAPGTVIRMQADHASVLSPSAYREWLTPLDDRMARAFDFSIFHLHDGNLHVLDSILAVAPLTAVQVSLDDWPAGPRLYEVVHRLREIQDAGKSLLITGGPISQEELDEALTVLSPSGLAMRVEIGSTWD